MMECGFRLEWQCGFWSDSTLKQGRRFLFDYSSSDRNRITDLAQFISRKPLYSYLGNRLYSYPGNRLYSYFGKPPLLNFYMNN
jgi:hypothetical protein